MRKMKLKTILLMIAILISLISAACLSKASVYDYEWVKVSLISQSPDPVEPGDTVDVRIKVENLGDQAAKDFQLEIMPEYPFTLYNSEDKLKSLSSLSAGDEYGINYKYTIKVDEKAVTGTSKLKFRYKYIGSSWVESSFDINIQSAEALLLIKEIKTVPEVLAHGEKGTIYLALENSADSLMRDISVDIDLSSSTMPISPLNTGTEKKIKTLKPKETQNLSFDIITLATADSKVHKVPIVLSYYDAIGTKHNKSDVISVIISSEPDLSYYIDESEILSAGTSGKVSIKLVNKGAEDVKYVNVKLKDSVNFVKLSADEVYAGNIDSDDYETAEFNIFVNRKVKALELPLAIAYKDSINRDYKEEVSIPLKLYSSSEAKKYKLAAGSSYLGLLIVLIVAAGGFFAYRRYYKKSKHHLQEKSSK